MESFLYSEAASLRGDTERGDETDRNSSGEKKVSVGWR